MDRFQHVVRFGIQGHTHDEFFQLSNSMTNPDKPVLMHHVGSSLTPVAGAGKNPSFNTVDIDVETLLPLEITGHYFDLVKANADG